LKTKFNEPRDSVVRAGFKNERDEIKLEMGKNEIEFNEMKNSREKKISEEGEFYKAKSECIK
jgi:hypothetical protein